ncbi:DNA topoisomerase [Pseudorhodoferax sp. Leaf267]|nr:DNA topoisomerase [Pseudorhodoferax sp. Leaf267]
MSSTPASIAAPPGLIYVSDDVPGISRHRRGKGFAYRKPDGSTLSDAGHLQRIRALAIPPAYTQVWICTHADGHIQATGRDARGRKQYRYHSAWREAQDADKYQRLLAFADVLPRIRRVVQRDLALPVGQQIQRASVLAAIVRLLDTTLVRVGNDSYARSNGSFGLTTLRARHAQLKGSQIKLRFKGKSGVEHDVAVDDPRVARIVRRCQTLPGQELFQYLDDDGGRHTIGSADVNDYLREASGAEFTAKDFRTWHGSVHALSLAAQQPSAPDSTLTARRSAAKAVLAEVARRLGNTVAVCRKAYVHPDVLALMMGERDSLPAAGLTPKRKAGLSVDERRFLSFLATAAAPLRTKRPRR